MLRMPRNFAKIWKLLKASFHENLVKFRNLKLRRRYKKNIVQSQRHLEIPSKFKNAEEQPSSIFQQPSFKILQNPSSTPKQKKIQCTTRSSDRIDDSRQSDIGDRSSSNLIKLNDSVFARITNGWPNIAVEICSPVQEEHSCEWETFENPFEIEKFSKTSVLCVRKSRLPTA